MLQINYDAKRVPKSNGVKRNARALKVIGRFSIPLHNQTSSTLPKALYSSVLKLEMYMSKKVSCYITGICLGQYKEGVTVNPEIFVYKNFRNKNFRVKKIS